MTLRLANQFDESLDSSASNQPLWSASNQPLWGVSTLPAKPVVLIMLHQKQMQQGGLSTM